MNSLIRGMYYVSYFLKFEMFMLVGSFANNIMLVGVN